MVLIGAMTTVAIGQGMHSLGGEKSVSQRNAGNPVSRPYQRLFITPEPGKAVQVQVAPEILIRPNPQPRVVCGMVVVPVTPAIDPKMVAQSKNDPNVDYKIRKIEPRICNE
jgi:hypothetical protein